MQAAQSKVSLRASNLPLRTLTAGLTAATDYEGTLTVQVEANDSQDNLWHGSLNAQLSGAAIRKHFENGRVETLSLGDGLVRAAGPRPGGDPCITAPEAQCPRSGQYRRRNLMRGSCRRG